ncbi:MAG TPA: hypothetical protein PL048_13605 [Leptospiraceae bacterium]|nr:hypothetical protein [Leptospiraceae bacterium]HMY67888.1 hypothetical protein [Leptospiraceae bacterium]HMZ59810.1 hypothetical protein [Leptospiraceae bacterium]HNF12919.1 hypothetical protein [Leptospiraceae bacterium]HNF24961.1 hypothetical protein [Leptospiraceae bacterium]
MGRQFRPEGYFLENGLRFQADAPDIKKNRTLVYFDNAHSRILLSEKSDKAPAQTCLTVSLKYSEKRASCRKDWT